MIVTHIAPNPLHIPKQLEAFPKPASTGNIFQNGKRPTTLRSVASEVIQGNLCPATAKGAFFCYRKLLQLRLCPRQIQSFVYSNFPSSFN